MHKIEYVGGVDLGSDDATAIVVVAFDSNTNNIYEMFSWKQRGLVISQVAAKIKEVQEMFESMSAIVVDTGGLGKQIAETIHYDYGIYMEPAQKSQKRAFIEICRGDVLDGRVYLIDGSPLHEEAISLVWKDEKKLEIHPACDDDCMDAFFYIRKYIHKRAKKKTEQVLDENLYEREERVKEMKAATEQDNPNKSFCLNGDSIADMFGLGGIEEW